MDALELRQAVETLLFITDQPIDAGKLAVALGMKDKDKEAVAAAVLDLKREYDERGGPVRVIEIAEGFQMATKPEFAPYVRNLYKERMTMRLSTAALETLAIIGYRQPLTRAEIEEIRGVEVIAALETLLEKALVKVVGRRETVGRPLLYGTTPEFLRHFGLRSIADLPPIDSFAPAEPTDAEKAALTELAPAPVEAAEPEPEPGPEPEPAPAEAEGAAVGGAEPENDEAR
ncbi:MAG: segregation and condensation protein B [Elusimicrobia bacterium]|nr:MAG: segregation and condensation protein B [Elusimicrobiota bacterium]